METCTASLVKSGKEGKCALGQRYSGQREREREGACVCVCEREGVGDCVREREREREQRGVSFTRDNSEELHCPLVAVENVDGAVAHRVEQAGTESRENHSLDLIPR